MNYVLLYSISLLLYQSLYTAEQHRFRHYLAQLIKSRGFEFTTLPNHHLHNGPNRNPIPA